MMMSKASVVAGRLKIRGERWGLGDRAAVDQSGDEQHCAEDRHFKDSPRADEARVDSHHQRNRNGRHDRKSPPRASFERVDHDEGQHRQ